MIDDFPSGIEISYICHTNGSINSIELGGDRFPNLIARDGSEGDPTGDFSIDVFGEWRIERCQKIIGSSRDVKQIREFSLKNLIGRKISGIETIGRLHDLEIVMKCGTFFTTFSTRGSNPHWMIYDRRSRPENRYFIKDGLISQNDGI